jgi:hypothetical protein
MVSGPRGRAIAPSSRDERLVKLTSTRLSKSRPEESNRLLKVLSPPNKALQQTARRAVVCCGKRVRRLRGARRGLCGAFGGLR